MKDVTARLLEAKDVLGYSYADIAKITGLPKSSIQRFLTGTTEKFPLEFLEPICNALQISAAEAMGWDDPVVVSATLEQPITNLSPEEQILVKAYREAMPEYQAVVMDILANHKKEETK